MFTWDDARYLLAIHRTRSLSSAGRRLGVNQSTVSRRLRALEDALGIRLFLQTPDGFLLSPAGERLLAHATRMEDEAIALEREASGEEARLTGTVRVTGPDALGARVVAPLLAALSERLPDVDFELVAENRTLSLTRREADMAVRTIRPREPHVVARKICPIASAVYASASYLQRHGQPRDGDWTSHRFISADEAMWAENLWLARTAPAARVVLKTNSTIAQLAATVAGMGLGILPCYLGDVEPGLVRIPASEPAVVRDIWLVIHRDLAHSPRIRACADHLVGAIGKKARDFAGRFAIRADAAAGGKPRPRERRA